MITKAPARFRPDVVAYYEETWLDFRVLWMTLGNPAFHFGYWDEGTRRHGQSLDNMNRVMADIARVSGRGSGTSQIWFNVRPKGETRILEVGDKFQIGSVKGEVSEIGVDDVLLLVDGKLRRLEVGDTLALASSGAV